MKVFLAVVEDLCRFVWQACTFSLRSKAVVVPVLPELERPLALKSKEQPVLLENPEVPTLLSEASSEHTYPTVTPLELFVQTETAPVHQAASLQVDGVVNRLPYGTSLSVVGAEGAFWRVAHGPSTAWIEKSLVTTDKKLVYPTFVSRNTYLALDAETKKLRCCIHDEFYTARVHSPLLGVEYVTYRLLERGQRIDWSAVARPRPAGTWHVLLRGNRNVIIKISPKTGSIMECREGDTAFLAYVESVSPDETISISSVGRYKPGQYLEEVLTKPAWQAVQPLWLQIS